MDNQKIPSRFAKSAPVEQPAGAESSFKQSVSTQEEALQFITVRFPNGAAFTYQADNYEERPNVYLLLLKREIVASVSKCGCVLELVNPFALDIPGQSYFSQAKLRLDEYPDLPKTPDSPGQMFAINKEEKPLGFFRALIRFFAAYSARPMIVPSYGDNGPAPANRPNPPPAPPKQ